LGCSWSLPAGSLDRWPEDYERGRPGWPPEVVDIPGLPSAATVLELGAGTGKLTRLLVPTFRRVVAVEPAEAMRRLLASLCPKAEAVAGSAEEIPLANASIDAVFAAEAFHRFDGERALAEIARVLRPRGVLVLMWNLPAGPTEPSIAAVERLLHRRGPDRAELGYDPLDLNTTRYASGEWRLVFADSPFEELQETRLSSTGGRGRRTSTGRDSLRATRALPADARSRSLDGDRASLLCPVSGVMTLRGADVHQSARNASRRPASSSSSRRTQRESGANGSRTTRLFSTRQMPATNPSTRNV
jgi:SAM-dependent methyltransferase